MTYARQHSHHDSSIFTWPRQLLVFSCSLLPLGLWLYALASAPGVAAQVYVGAGAVLVALSLPFALRPRARRSAQRLALTSVAALIWALPAPLLLPLYWWPLLLLAAFLVLLSAGLLSLLRFRPIKGVPAADLSPTLVLRVAMDELVLGYFVSTLKLPQGKALQRTAAESHAAHALFREQGWLQEPQQFHLPPPVPTQMHLEAARFEGLDYTLACWPSGYVPHAQLPGRERWMGYAPLRQMQARLFRHAQPGRPWLICIHGYRMGREWADFRLFNPAWLHHELGFNLAFPLLPLHGERKLGWRSGDGFLDGDLMDTINALAQAQWDIRSLLAWLRQEQQAESISVLGYSLGGYNAALLAGLEPGLERVVAAIPLVDVATVMWENGPRAMLEQMQALGMGQAELRRILRVVSPLAVTPQVPLDRRFIIAGSADRIVPLPPIMDLWRHWQRPRMDWFNGTHLSIRKDVGVPALLAEYLLTRH